MSRFGISAALLTPFFDDGSVNSVGFANHAADLLSRGLGSVTAFGTSGEGASLSAAERLQGLKSLIEGGVPASKLVSAVYATSIHEGIEQVEAGHALGIRTFLLVPPFYFKGVGDEGVFDWHALLLSSCSPETEFVLYHIPQVTGVSLSPELVSRLVSVFPGRIRGIKDSSGDWDTAQSYLALDSVPVLIGDERLLHRGVALGAAGAISGMANLYPERMMKLFESGNEDADLSAEVTRIVSQPVVPALKAVLARQSGSEGWETVRPPLTTLNDEAKAALLLA